MRLLLRCYSNKSTGIEPLSSSTVPIEAEMIEINSRVEPSESSELQEVDENDEDNQSNSSWRCWKYWLPPFWMTTDDHIKHRWKSLLFISILYVAGLAEACLEITTRIAIALNISNHFLGVVLVALGAQIPDTFGSLAVAKKGEGPGAVSNAIGSQVMNILLGLGLPFFLASAIKGSSIHIDYSNTQKSSVVLLITISLLFILSLRRKFLPACLAGQKRYGLSKADACILLGVYLCFILWEFSTLL